MLTNNQNSAVVFGLYNILVDFFFIKNHLIFFKELRAELQVAFKITSLKKKHLCSANEEGTRRLISALL